MQNPLLEIACFSLEAAQIAQNAGASRIELCMNKLVGGITPPYSVLEAARKAIKIPLFVMIRPRAGNFVYNKEEIEQMKADIAFCKQIGIDGVVFGVLGEDKTLNFAQNKELLQIAAPLSCTFHRAFDEISDKATALMQLIDCGFQNILTSGGEGNAVDFLGELENLVKLAENKICIMAGGGVRSGNAAQIYAKTQAKALHSAASISGELPDNQEIINLKAALNIQT